MLTTSRVDRVKRTLMPDNATTEREKWRRKGRIKQQLQQPATNILAGVHDKGQVQCLGRHERRLDRDILAVKRGLHILHEERDGIDGLGLGIQARRGRGNCERSLKKRGKRGQGKGERH